MNDNRQNKIPACAGTQDRENRQIERRSKMPTKNFITRLYHSQYFRNLIVRAIEDGIILFLLFAAVWSLAHVVSGIFRILGVA